MLSNVPLKGKLKPRKPRHSQRIQTEMGCVITRGNLEVKSLAYHYWKYHKLGLMVGFEYRKQCLALYQS